MKKQNKESNTISTNSVSNKNWVTTSSRDRNNISFTPSNKNTIYILKQ